MRIVMIAENDPAGMGIAFCNAINRYTNHTCRIITTQERYGFDYEADIHIPDIEDDDFGEVEHLLKDADIFHFHMLKDENAHLGPLVIKDYIKGKKVIHHHHGHPVFRSDPLKFYEKYKKLNRKSIVSTPDLLKLLPGSIWVPNIVPIHNPLFMPKERVTDNKVRVCQAPTRKDLKNTEEFISVMGSLMRQYNILEYQIIENTQYLECLRLKQGFDIHFDHMQGYFGVSSLESLSLGKPVIAGLDDWNIQCIKNFTGSDQLPWIVARCKEDLYEMFEVLVTDHELRKTSGEYSRLFMEKYWTEKHALSILMGQYESL